MKGGGCVCAAEPRDAAAQELEWVVDLESSRSRGDKDVR